MVYFCNWYCSYDNGRREEQVHLGSRYSKSSFVDNMDYYFGNLGTLTNESGTVGSVRKESSDLEQGNREGDYSRDYSEKLVARAVKKYLTVVFNTLNELHEENKEHTNVYLYATQRIIDNLEKAIDE